MIAAFSSWWLARGHVGRALSAIRQDEDLAAARGLDVFRYKQLVFVFAAGFAGLSGALYASMQIAIDPSSFTIWSSFQYVIYVIIGGSGTLLGPAIGVVFLVVLDQFIQDFGKWNQIVLGGLIVFTVLFFRGGLWAAPICFGTSPSNPPASGREWPRRSAARRGGNSSRWTPSSRSAT